MKKIFLVLSVFFLCFSTVQADEIDDGLPQGTVEQIKIHTRSMVAVGIPSEEAVKMTRTMMQNQFQNQNILRAQQTVINAVENGLPATPVINKLYEGIAKGIPADTVVQAMDKTRRRYAHSYSYARGLAKSPGRIDNIGNALAQGLAAGMREADVDRTIQTLRKRTLQMTRTRSEALAEESALCLKTMARYGISSETAADVVCEGLKQQLNLQEMKQIRQSYMQQTTNPAQTPASHDQGQGMAQGSGSSGSSGGSDGSGGSNGSDGSGGSSNQ